MTQEVIRRHYLEAMGITAWASRYQLPNAMTTEACEWEESVAAPVPHREQLQALLDDAPPPRRAPSESSPPDATIASPSAVRALLTETLGQEEKRPQRAPSPQQQTATSGPEAAPSTPAKPLKFSLSSVCLNGRWLVMQAGEMNALEQQLLINLLQAAGIQQDALPEPTLFRWPPMDNGVASEDPLDEAREGLAAFMAGSVGRQGWTLERLLWWGEFGAEPAPLDRILNIADGHSQTLSLPVWQGPSLASLLDGTQSKRDLWPALQALGQQWLAGGQVADDHRT